MIGFAVMRHPQGPTAYDDDFEGQPTQSGFHQWVLGAAVPVGLAVPGVHAIATRAASYGSPIPLALRGVDAVALGVAVIAAAAFLHAHYFWRNIYDGAWFAVLGKIAAAIAFIAGLGWLIVRGFLFGL